MIPEEETEVEDDASEPATEVCGPETVFPEFTTPQEVNSTLLSLPRLIGISVDRLLFARRDAKKASRDLAEHEAFLYHDLRYGKDRRYTKEDVKILYARDTKWLGLKRTFDLADAKVEYYEGRVRMLKETNWALNSYVKHQKYLAGDFNE